mgnify:CR=1 FL=1
MKKMLECIVCGRRFPEGQGIKIDVGDRVLVFHSKSCTLKFMRILLERLPREELKKAIRETLEEYDRIKKERKSATSKKI